jgi:hypothetical protein
MKKLILASVMALASISLFTAPMLRAQDPILIKDPAEYNSYQSATTQTDPKAKAAALENFLTTYPQSVVKQDVLDRLIDAYQAVGDPDKTLGAATRQLQADPNNLKAIFISVYIKKLQCAKTSDAQTCDDAAILAQKGLSVVKPVGTSADDWKKLTGGTYTTFHSAIALDDIVSKKDIKGGISEYRTELMLYPPDQTKSGPGLWDTLQLAEAYTKPGAKDADEKPLVQAVWFYARAWNFAPNAAFKGQIETKLEWYFKKYHGNLTGLDEIKAQAAATLFPPGTFVLSAAPTPAEVVHKLIVETSDLNSLALADKEYILAVGSKEDADKLWALLKDQLTPVPGIVIEATASVVKVAVTQDAKDAKVADFVVNLKTPLADKDIPAVGFEYKVSPATTLIGTYDSYTQIPATATTAQTAQIVLRDGEIQLEKKKPAAAPVHKPAAGHKPAAK